MGNAENPYAILFEPLKVGPKIARNRFYQAPHCNGMGRSFPSSMARMRGTKAEGGWAIVCTEQCDIHWTSDTVREIRLWDDRDIPYLARMVEEVHAHDSLAAIELVHMGYYGRNLLSRESTMSPSGQAPATYYPGYARAMDKEDIRDLRRWHRNAALRAKKTGYDCVIVYAGHNISIAMHFLGRRHNRRTDEYGGSLMNRTRLLRELIVDTKDAVGDSCAVILRLAVDELMGEKGIVHAEEGREIVSLLAELPDLWDVNCSDWNNDSITARFAEEGFQEPYVAFVKGMTTKPVVGVGRYTSPDRMVSLLKSGTFDMIGAARPSIADPFLPEKIRQGRIEDIRECIGCNICVAYSNNNVPMRCTQNPTVGEEWRRGWHPEKIPPRETEDRVLVIGAGPAGLEAAMTLGKRGYEVVLAEARPELGGRVARESRLPGLSSWGRVRDYRAYQISQMGNVDVFRESPLDADQVLEMGFSLVAIATGATWRKDGIGRGHFEPLPGCDRSSVYTPDDIMSGADIRGPVVIYDTDHYYMGGVLAEAIRLRGLEVTLVTSMPVASAWTEFTLEQGRIQTRLHELGIEILPLHSVDEIGANDVTLSHTYTRSRRHIEAASVVLVTTLVPSDTLYYDLLARQPEFEDRGVRRIVRIGDCYGPSTIAQAVWSGHRFARTLGESESQRDEVPFNREIMELASDF
ncbi:MAG TPA: FAD-dependent oxidoreductase [Alphaproteobacteria bacterium]|nr:FAD-dependent oxidoreductase [Alphaproteobacteria bacterium]